MKNRTLPFGYQYKNGAIVPCAQECTVLKQITADYLSGKSLLKIATLLNEEQIEYMPGVVGWNKARLKRILEDRRYLGDDIYTPIIDPATYAALQKLKSKKNTQKQVNRKADIFHLDVPISCPICGNEMHRRNDIRCACAQRWTCQNAECKKLIIMSDSTLINSITQLLNIVIQDPNIIQTIASSDFSSNTELSRLENEISRALNSAEIDKENLQKKMMRCVSLKYNAIDSASCIAKKLKADFENAKPLSAFSMDLFKKTVQSITLETNATVRIILINNQEIRKE